MAELDCDVAVIGGSIAGCTAATLLARRGAKVALIESHEDPQAYKRMCTHVFQGSCSPTLERLGLLEDVRAAGARPTAINMWSRYGWAKLAPTAATSITGDHTSLNLRRETFDPMIRKLALRTEGVEPMLGHRAVSLLRSGGRTSGVVVRDRDGAERQLRTQVVVAADGRGSGVAEMAGLPTKHRVNNRFAYFAYYRDTPLVTGSDNQIWFLDPDMAYAFPTDDGLTLMTCVPHKDRRVEFRREPEAALERMFADLPDAPDLDPDKRVSKLLGKLEITNESRPPAQPGLALVGDAAIASDPIWGVGCGWALQSSEMLAEEISPVLGDTRKLDSALRRYGRRHRRAFVAHDRVSSSYSTGRRFLPPERVMYRAAVRDPEVAGRMGLFGERWIHPSRVMTPRIAARVLRAGLSPDRGRREAPFASPGPASETHAAGASRQSSASP